MFFSVFFLCFVLMHITQSCGIFLLRRRSCVLPQRSCVVATPLEGMCIKLKLLIQIFLAIFTSQLSGHEHLEVPPHSVAYLRPGQSRTSLQIAKLHILVRHTLVTIFCLPQSDCESSCIACNACHHPDPTPCSRHTCMQSNVIGHHMMQSNRSKNTQKETPQTKNITTGPVPGPSKGCPMDYPTLPA